MVKVIEISQEALDLWKKMSEKVVLSRELKLHQ